MAPDQSPGATETDAEKVARLEQENADLKTAEAVEDGAEAPAPAEPVAPLAALAASVESSPDLTFSERLVALSDEGIYAHINPADESKVLGALAAVVADIAKVKLS